MLSYETIYKQLYLKTIANTLQILYCGIVYLGAWIRDKTKCLVHLIPITKLATQSKTNCLLELGKQRQIGI